MADCVCKLVNVLLFFVCNVYFLDITKAQITGHVKPAAEFSKHTLIKAKIYHGREKRQISSNFEKIGLQFLTVQYSIGDTNHILDLRLNKELIPSGYFRKYQKNGKYIIDKPSTYDVDICHYQGKLRGVQNSWAAISTCDGSIKGVVYDGKELNHIEKAYNDEEEKAVHHFLYKHSDLIETTNKSCGYEGTHEHGHLFSSKEDFVPKRFKRAANDASTIRGPYNANKLSRYVELVLVIDNREYKDLGENLQRVYQHCKDIANIINGLYSSLNIFIALVGVVVWTERDEIELSPKGDTTLTNFLHYRREVLIKEHPNDNAQLLTKYTFDGGVVGKALKGPICTFEYSGGVSMDHSHVIGLVATTVAHEMGHNFGMEHDTNDCDCPDERCIMAPSSSLSSPTHWSACSLEYLALAFEHGMDYCLRNKPVSLFDSPVCGNGFVEPGEQCDCGLPQTCDNTCCNATTCMLYSNATCATGECCDLKTCRPKSAGSLCRAADYECDLPEYCTGESEYCPVDIYKMNTEECDGGRAFCYHGSCRTRTDQCRLLWGNTGKSSDDQCYMMNVKGSRHGNCGYHRVNQSFIKCEDENVLCGMLHCRHLNERLEFGMESVAILSQSFINLKGNIIPCRTALVDLGLNQVDPGLAPDGASCGKGKMCVNQKCMSVESLRAGISKCPHDCNNNGVCNSLGHCHCKEGFSPPFCDYPGPGGSEDSGPASDPNARKDFIKAMYIIFLGVIPTLAIVALLIYYPRYHLKLKWPSTGGATNKSSKPSPKSRGNNFNSDLSKREDNSSLLQENQSCFQSEFFGHFKGFHISPINSTSTEEENKIPVRAVSLVPSSPYITNINTTNNSSTIKKVPRSSTAPDAMVKPQIHSTENGNAVQLINNNNPPALPPLNAGAHPRPLISSPILKASTCSAKELVSPLKNAPKTPVRPAPEVPQAEKTPTRPLSQPLSPSVALTIEKVQQKEAPSQINKTKETTSTLNRIASFLKPKEDKNKTATPSQNGVKLSKNIDKDTLRSIEISGPIPQADAGKGAEPQTEKTKNVVMRAQSMRSTNTPTKPNIQSFGSMRQPGKRPTSIPVGNRPSSPPPRPPQPEIETENMEKIPGVPGYQEPAKIHTAVNVVPPVGKAPKCVSEEYDDCLNESPLAKISEESPTDNIYAVIEENPKSLGEKNHSTSNESFGLLGEIVSEIQNRNFDSIYSTSTLARKKKERIELEEMKKRGDNSENYVNTSSLYKAPISENLYSNMGNMVPSSASSTASGYIHPASVNVPVKQVPDKKEEPQNKLSTFKSDKPEVASYKPYHSTLQRNPGPLATNFNNKNTSEKLSEKKSEVKSPTSPASKTPKVIGRQVTPVNLRTRKPSPNRNTNITSNKNNTKTNSPDLVISCSTTQNTKSPDVLNSSAKISSKPNGVLPKPIVTPKIIPKTTGTNVKSPTINKVKSPPSVTKSKVNDSKQTVNSVNSSVNNKLPLNNLNKSVPPANNVASLQQKFENKNQITAKTK